MKKMKALKQQMTTALSLALVVMVMAVCWPTQTLAQQRARKTPSTNVQPRSNPPQRGVINVESWSWSEAKRTRPAGTEGAKMPGTSTKEFDKGYLSPYASSGYRGTTTVNQGTRAKDTLSGGGGNDAIKSSQVQRPNQATLPNQFRTGDQASGYREPKSIMTATTYGRGSFAKTRGKRSR